MKPTRIRDASDDDIEFLRALEKLCFADHRQSSRRSLKNSISSPNQYVFIIEKVETRTKRIAVGSAIVICYKHSMRIYSIAIHPDHRGQGMGDLLVQHIINIARKYGYDKITLEADYNDRKLIDWYQKFSFEETQRIDDFYGLGEPAYRMVHYLNLHEPNSSFTENIIVVDNTKKDAFEVLGAETVSAKEYLSSERFRHYERYNVLNLCNSYKTHTLGYYVSLLASARNHRVVPTVMTLKDISNISIAQSLLEEIKDFVQAKLKTVKEEFFELTVILGNTPRKEYSDMAKKLFRLFEIPFFNIVFRKKECWRIKKLNTLNVSSVVEQYPDEFYESMTKYFQNKRHRRTQLKNYKYDLAILVNNDEKTPPSSPAALDKFRNAAEQVGFFVEFIGKIDYQRICEFDALFIRETTAIENHTYRFARHAYTEGLVVIDDPWSILYCSNKIYLHERLTRGRNRLPKSWLLTKGTITKEQIKSLVFPLVLKLPESTFSLGVYRVQNSAELLEKLDVMFEGNDLVIAQEFLKSEFDWRIGVLDNTPLFACKYYMASGHWQIYNWAESNHDDMVGNSETVPINQVPAHILKAAMKSSSMIGDGLYGVDLKDINGKAYVIEINDNPNIDAGIEDQIMQDELYMRIMTSFFNRIERERQQPRYVI